MRTLMIFGSLALATGLAAAPATAEPGNTLVVQGSRLPADSQRIVRYGDLQLASATGREQLRTRVGMAIADLCDPSRFSVAEPVDALKCRADAWAAVTPRLEQISPRLAAR
jgi:UrcA family protein